MTRPEGQDGGIYSSDSAGQTPSLASIYQVRGDVDNVFWLSGSQWSGGVGVVEGGAEDYA